MASKLLLGFVFGAVLSWSPAVLAEDYPTRPVTMIVPFPAGGPADTVGRIMAERMRVSLGQSIVVENIVGANGTVGIGRLSRAAPDGYTIGIGHWSTNVINGAVYDLPYDLVKDFAPVARLVSGPQLLVANKKVPAENLQEFIAWLKANPGRALAGTAGAGSQQHISGIYFQSETKTDFSFVPYHGAAPAMQDLIGGRIDFMFDLTSNSLPQIRAGTIKAYGVTEKERLVSASDIPTISEGGLPGFYVSVWFAVWAPAGTPSAIVNKLNMAAVDAMSDPKIRARFQDLGQDVPPRNEQSPEALAAFQKAEIEKWWPLIKAAKIRAE